MKKTLIALLAIAGSLHPAYAQISLKQILGKQMTYKANPFVKGILNQQINAGRAQKPTGIKQRVLAQVLRSDENDEMDTTLYTYSSTLRGSTFDFNDLLYNQTHTLMNNPVFTPFEYQEIPTAINAALADSILHNDSGFGMENSKSVAHYNSANKIDTLWINDDGIEGFTTNYYNTSGYAAASIEWDGSDTMTLRKIYYNPAFTQVIADTTIYYSNNTPEEGYDIWNYTYTSGKITEVQSYGVDMNGVDTFERYSFSYNTSGQLITALSESHNGGGYINESKDSFAYQTGVDYNIAEYNYDYYSGNSNTYEAQRFIKTVGSNGLPDSLTIGFKGSNESTYTDEVIGKYTYNSFENPESIDFKFVEDGVLSPVDVLHFEFYYEEYDDQINSITQIDQHKNYKVYPNPFTDHIQIAWSGVKANQSVSVRLLNILGQPVFEAKENLKNGSNNLHIPEIAKGNYILLLQDEYGKTWSKKMVKH